MVDFLHQSLAALCVENFEIFFQISQYSLLGEKVGNLFSCHIVLMLVLLHAESHKENLVQFFILRHDLYVVFCTLLSEQLSESFFHLAHGNQFNLNFLAVQSL